MRFVKLWISVLALFSVTALGLTGCGGGGGGGGTPVPTPGASVPAAPTGVAAAPVPGNANTQVSVNWGTVTGATSYNVYWSTTSGLPKEQRTKVAGVTATTFTQSNLQSGTKYYYVVTAVNSVGESAVSAEASATTTVSPAAVSATPAATQVTVTWDAVPGASSYNLYYSTSSNIIIASATKVPGASPGQVVSQLTNDTQYFFVVTAVINGVESDPSLPVSAIPSATPTLPAPSRLQASSFLFTEPQISLTWGNVPNADSYKVYFSTTPNVTKATNSGSFTAAQGSGTQTTFHPPLVDLRTTTYYFVITAVDANGVESTESPVLKVIPPAFTQTMVSGKTVSYKDAPEGTPTGKTFVFVASPDGSLTFTSTLGSGPTSGVGTWRVNIDGSLTVLIPNGSLTFNYDVFQTTNNGSLFRVTFTNGSQTSSGEMTFM